jgi:hypothetical protein
MVVPACNPSTGEAEAGDYEFGPGKPSWKKPCLKKRTVLPLHLQWSILVVKAFALDLNCMRLHLPFVHCVILRKYLNLPVSLFQL